MSLYSTGSLFTVGFTTSTVSKIAAPKKITIACASSSAAQHENFINVGTKIVAVGRNYAAHAKELGNAVPKEPVLFMKPTTSYLENEGTIEIPHNLKTLDHEVELAVVIAKRARDVPESSAMDYVGGYALALDMTAREIQSSLKEYSVDYKETFAPVTNMASARIGVKKSFLKGLPWTIAKGQDTFTPISSILPRSIVPHPHDLELWLKVDGEIRQKGSTKDMIFTIPYLISHISSMITLLEGDVILTGTPKGAGPVKAGQKITAGITGLIEIQFNIEKRQRSTTVELK